MLNYIWLGLLVLGIATALTLDISNESSNKFRNGESMEVSVMFDSSFANSAKQFDATLTIPQSAFAKFYNVVLTKDVSQKIKLSYNEKEKKYSVYFLTDDSSPAIWQEMAKVSGKENDLSGALTLKNKSGANSYAAVLSLEKISFSKMKEVTNSAIDYAGKAVNIAIGLIGIMALWLGIMKIAEQAGLVAAMGRSVKPITKFLFPDVPQDHPAIGSMIMNISANMLGLGNAATPFGLKAMEELDSINLEKGTASNAMVTFLAINTAGLTLIPATAIAIRAAAGSSDPAIIIGTSFFGASCATFIGILAAKTLEKFYTNGGDRQKGFANFFNFIKSGWKFFITLFAIALIIILLAVSGIFSKLTFVNSETLKSVIQMISILAIPLIIISFVTYGAIKKVKLYEAFVEGAKEGFNVAVRIIPYLVAMLVAIGIFRAGGAMDFLVIILSPITNLIGMPAEAMPMALMRPLSGSGSLGIMSEMISVHGPDTFLGILVSTIMGSTETTFYVLALYFGSVNIKKTRHAVAVGVLADVAGILGALFIVKLLFG